MLIGCRAVGLRAALVFILSVLAACTQGVPIFVDPSLSDDEYCTDERKANYPYANSGEAGMGAVSPIAGNTICTVFQFAQIPQQPSGMYDTYYLMADLDLSSVSYVHVPIGSGSGSKFLGQFFGNGHEIQNLSYSGTGSESGLFGYIGPGGVVQGLRVVNANVSGTTNVGILAGVSEGHISRSMSSGSVFASNLWSGGLVGALKGGALLDDCYSTAAVSSTARIIGALVGINTSSTILRCYATGYTTSSGDGLQSNLVGYNNLGTNIEFSFGVGDIYNSHTGPSNVAFVIGQTSVIYLNNYYSGSCSAASSCYTDRGTFVSDPTLFYSSSQAPLDSWDFTNVWIERAGDYPELR